VTEERAPLDDDVAAVAEAWAREGIPEWHQLSVGRARELEDDLFAPVDPAPVDVVRDLAFDGPGGPVDVRLYRDADPPAPGLVFYHGGGWTLGTLDSADDICRALARRGDCAVVSVDYRLAPEHPFPAALDDAAAALAWTAAVADRLGIDPDRISVGGTSAGGNLAAATALRVRDRLPGDPPACGVGGRPAPGDAAFPELAGQLLLYPILDPAMDTASYREQADGPFLTADAMAWFWENYLPSPVAAANSYAAPALADDLAGLPPATVATAGHDPLREEGRRYADRLADAGVAVERVHEPALAHGFLSMADDSDAAEAALDRVAARVADPPG
jgi:acetyl esterase